VKTLNLGILAHVDAGKTSLTERLLFAAGVIDEIGSVDDGSTQTDSLALERQRGITIKAAVVSFPVGDLTVNLIDTPGHPDFIAEVERVLSVLDGAVLVISAVAGVQAQTRVLMRALRRLGIPALIFVNKIDCAGAQEDRTLRGIREKLTPEIMPMGSVRGIGTRAAAFRRHQDVDAGFTAALTELLADHDDEFLAAYVADEAAVSHRQLVARFAASARRGAVYPVFFGSAITGAGLEPLTAGIRELLPVAGGGAGGPVSGRVFKVERGPAGEKIAYVRMFSGAVHVRDRLRFGRERAGKVTAVSVFDRGDAAAGTSVADASVEAGQIGKLWGLGEVRIGDAVGQPAAAGPGDRAAPRQQFAPPTLETVVVPCRASDRGALHAALTQLAEQDPLINLRRGDGRQEIVVSLYGEVQKEVIQATLASDFGIEVGFSQTTTLYVERLTGTGAAAEIIAVAPNPFLATVGLRIEPAPPGDGVRFGLEVELGSLPLAFVRAVEESVHATLAQGLHGWQVSDAAVTMTHSGYWARQSHAHGTFDKSMSSTAGDFRNLTPLVLMTALRQAGTRVHEPVHRFHLEVGADSVAAVMPVLGRLRATAQAPVMHGTACVLEGGIPAACVHELRQQLPALTRGEGMLESAFDHYRPVRGAIPARPRTDHNPLNRKEYLLNVQRKLAGHAGA
jgi:ribosomal protection tetracycline resistance protein